MPEETDILVGIDSVAEFLGKSTKTVRRYLAEGMPRLGEKRFHREQVKAWFDERKKIRAPRSPGYQDPKQLTFGQAGGEGKDYHDERLKRAKADEAEIKVRQLKGELVALAEVDQLHVARGTVVKQGLLTFARSLPPRLIHCKDEREMEVVIMGAVRELLEAFSSPLPESLSGGKE